MVPGQQSDEIQNHLTDDLSHKRKNLNHFIIIAILRKYYPNGK